MGVAQIQTPSLVSIFLCTVNSAVFSLENYQGVGGGCGLEFSSMNLGHTHCHIKGIWMQKTWGPPTPKGPRENTVVGYDSFNENEHFLNNYEYHKNN